ncbi:MAG: GNAT family N-acetyltransferase [Actinomycetota bacterium]
MPPEIDDRVYMRSELPRELEIQVLAFARILWDDTAAGDDRLRDRLDDDREGVHFVRAAGNVLVSHVEVIPVDVEESQGRTMRIGGVGGVMTYPAFRGEGHASALMRKAGEHIRGDRFDFDIGMLFCDPENASFYSRLGWKPLASERVLVDGSNSQEMIMTLGDPSALPPVLHLTWTW